MKLFALYFTISVGVTSITHQVASNPAEDTCVYTFQVPRQDGHAACTDSASLDQQLLKTMVLSLQHQVTRLQEHLSNTAGVGRNIRQCSWRNVNDNKPEGSVRTCSLQKRGAASALRVVWNGGMRLFRRGGSAAACRRWFLTINDVECQTPAAIDAQVHTKEQDEDYSHPVYLEGLCRGIPAGQVVVALNIGPCEQPSYAAGYPLTGWTATTRIIVEEVEAIDPDLVT